MSEQEIRRIVRTVCADLDLRARRAAQSTMRRVVIPTALGVGLALSGCADTEDGDGNGQTVDAGAQPEYMAPAPGGSGGTGATGGSGGSGGGAGYGGAAGNAGAAGRAGAAGGAGQAGASGGAGQAGAAGGAGQAGVGGYGGLGPVDAGAYDGGAVPEYIAPPPDGGPVALYSAPLDAGPVPPYMAAPPDAGQEADSMTRVDTGVQPDYMAPPPDAGAVPVYAVPMYMAAGPGEEDGTQ